MVLMGKITAYRKICEGKINSGTWLPFILYWNRSKSKEEAKEEILRYIQVRALAHMNIVLKVVFINSSFDSSLSFS